MSIPFGIARGGERIKPLTLEGNKEQTDGMIHNVQLVITSLDRGPKRMTELERRCYKQTIGNNE